MGAHFDNAYSGAFNAVRIENLAGFWEVLAY